MKQSKLLLLMAICGCLIQPGYSQQLAPKAAVEALCRSEFWVKHGYPVGARMDIVVYSSKRQVIEEKSDNQFANKVVFIDSSELIVASTYTINTVNVFASSAIVKVVFDRIARTRGEGVGVRSLIKDIRKKDSVVYQLKKIKNKWMIYDPPLPRVSIESMIAEFEDGVRVLQGTNPRLSEWYKTELKTLESAKSCVPRE